MEQLTAILALILMVIVMKVDIVYTARQPKLIKPIEKRVDPHTATAIQKLFKLDMSPTNEQWRAIIRQILNDPQLILDEMNPGDAARIREIILAVVMGYVMSNTKEEVF